MSTPALVGRAAELARIDAALAVAAAGRARVIAIAGEPGIGKTRLAREAIARARDFLVLEGRAHPVGGELAYAPVLEAFGRALRAVGERRRATLVAGLPELGRLFVGMPGLPAGGAGDPALDKIRLFEAMLRLVERLAAEAPVALVIDDLHWADRATLELVHHLARGAERERFAIVATWRSDPAEATDGFVTMVQSLRRLDVLDEIVLARLDAEAVGALAGGLLEGAAPAELLAVLGARTGGVPLFVEMLVRDLIESGRLVRAGGDWVLAGASDASPPSVVRDAIAGRLERLGEDERRVLAALAVGSGATAHDVLVAVVGLDEAPLAAALRRLRGAGLIVEEAGYGAVEYGAGHPLVFEVVYAELAAATRRRLHLAFAAALDRGGEHALDQQARHYRGAGSDAAPQRTLEILLAAGARALAVAAADEAASCLAAAVTVVRAHGGAPLADVLERLGDAWQRAGRGAAALTAWREALTLVADPRVAGRLHHRIGTAELDRGWLEVAHAEYAAALDRLGELAPSAELAALHRSRAALFDRVGNHEGLAGAVADLDAIAAALDAVAPRVDAELARARLHLGGRELVLATAAVERAVELAGADDELRLAAHDGATVVAVERFDLGAIRRHAAASLALAVRRAAPAYQMRALGYTATAMFLAGEWTEMDGVLRTITAVAHRFAIPRGLARVTGMRGMLAFARGDLAAAAERLDEARAIARAAGLDTDRHLDGSFAVVDAWLLVERDEPAARAHAGRHASAVHGLQARLTGPGDLRALRLVTAAELAAHLGDAAAARSAAEGLVRDGGPGLDGFADRAAAAVHTVEGDAAAAYAAHARAAAGLSRAGIVVEAAREALLAIPDDAPDALARCEQLLATFEHFGARRWADRARRRIRALGGRPAPARRPTPDGGPLSAREREVAALYADGLTTAEVARRLVISPHTAATHLQRIYRRLGIRSRAELARYLITGIE